jgi:hypothetical protein
MTIASPASRCSGPKIKRSSAHAITWQGQKRLRSAVGVAALIAVEIAPRRTQNPYARESRPRMPPKTGQREHAAAEQPWGGGQLSLLKTRLVSRIQSVDGRVC